MEKEANWKYIVYCTTNLVNDKIYVGVHKTKDATAFDGYIGNGIYISQPYTYKYSKTKFQCAVNKYGVSNFVRKTLAIYDSEESAYLLEEDIVNEQFLQRADVYNMVLGGFAGLLESQKIRVYKYDLDGNYVCDYASFADAGLAVNKDCTLISYAVRKKMKGGGYYWSTDKVDKIDLSLYNLGNNHKIQVHMYLTQGNYIKSFDSQSEAAIEVSSHTSNIREAAILGNCVRKTYYFSYILAATYDIARSEYIKTRTIYQYSTTGEFIQEYKTQELAEIKYPGVNITKAIKLKSLDTNGYLWGLVKLDNYNVQVTGKGNKKRVGKYTLDRVLVCEYDSATAASKENGTSVWKVLAGTNNTHKGHIYAYI